MTEHRLFTGDVPYVSTAAFHAGRERAPHLEQDMHQARLVRCAELIRCLYPFSVVDLGCGDGGLLELLAQEDPEVQAWGYDFQPSNQAGWQQRGVTAELRDVFNDRDVPRWGEVAVLTEVLEHLADPHGVLEWVAHNAVFVVASSPHGETAEHHAAEHAWAWDMLGYATMIGEHFHVMRHEQLDWTQLIVGRSKRR